MAKKDFSTDTEDILSAFFPTSTRAVADKNTKNESEKDSITNKNLTTKSEKTQAKSSATKNNKPQTKGSTKKDNTDNKNATLKAEPKSYNKNYRYNFYIEPELADFLNNYFWLTRQKNYSQYFNHLIKQNLLEILELPQNTPTEKMIEKWEEYKKVNKL